MFSIIALNIFLAPKVHAQNKNNSTKHFPTPQFKSNTQFYLQRTTDINTIMYELNITNGKLNESNPINAYWIRYTENGKTQSLNALQKRYAFGVSSKKINNNHFQLFLAGYPKIPLNLRRKNNNKYQTSIAVGEQEIIVQKLHIEIKPGGSFWSPNVSYIEIAGLDAMSGKYASHRIYPK